MSGKPEPLYANQSPRADDPEERFWDAYWDKKECAWCGSIEPDVRCSPVRWYPNVSGEDFCSPWHRSASNRALKRFIQLSEEVTT